MPLAPYTIENHDLILDNPSRQYVLRIRDLPNEEKPREKLLKHGPSILSAAELLAVVLTTGTTKEGVLEMTERIMQEYGEKSILSRPDAKLLAEELNIPEIKAAQIAAVGELGRRFYRKSGVGMAVIRTVDDVYAYAVEMRTLPKEHLRGLYLNPHYQVIHDEVLSIGTIDANLIHPREVFRPALQYAAAGVVLVHNHPSGVTDPSQADLAVTKQVAEAGRILGIDLIDHVIVHASGFSSVPFAR